MINSSKMSTNVLHLCDYAVAVFDTFPAFHPPAAMGHDVSTLWVYGPDRQSSANPVLSITHLETPFFAVTATSSTGLSPECLPYL